MARKNKTGMWIAILGSGALLWWVMSKKPAAGGPGMAAELPTTMPPVTVIPPAVTTTALTATPPALGISSAIQARQIAAQWAAGHNDGNWVNAINNMSDSDVTLTAYLLQRYIIGPNAPGTYGMTGPDGQSWVYITSKYGVA